uniref:Uncharacterized protein n=1 Tax=Arion vulgaris TaxID=1028688 RepID=A0A0B7C330_9EUPU
MSPTNTEHYSDNLLSYSWIHFISNNLQERQCASFNVYSRGKYSESVLNSVVHS